MLVIKTLLWVACPACSALILAPLVWGPLPDWLCVAWAISQPLAAVGFVRLIRRATLQQIIDLVDRES